MKAYFRRRRVASSKFGSEFDSLSWRLQTVLPARSGQVVCEVCSPDRVARLGQISL